MRRSRRRERDGEIETERERERDGDGKEGGSEYSPRAPCPSSCLLGRVNQRARTANNYPRDTSHVAATTCSSRATRLTVSAHLAATVSHPRAPRRRPRAGGGKRPPGRAEKRTGIARQRSPATRTVTRTCPTCRPRNHRLPACLLPSLPPPSGLTASNRPEFRRGALYRAARRATRKRPAGRADRSAARAIRIARPGELRVIATNRQRH